MEVLKFLKNTELPELISFIANILIFGGGFIAIVFLVKAAIELIISGGSPTRVEEAKKTIKNAILGLILLVGSYTSLRTINPLLVTPTMTPLPPAEGLYYTNGTDFLPAPFFQMDNSQVPQGWQLFYKCTNWPALYLWLFPKKDFQAIDEKGKDSGISVKRITCGTTLNLSSEGSYKASFEQPGLYICAGQCNTEDIICNDNMSEAISSNIAFPELFKNNQSISLLFVNNPTNNIYYSAIFLSNPFDEVGNCSNVYNLKNKKEPPKERVCYTLKENPPSLNYIIVFIPNYDNPENLGEKIVFYSEPWGPSIGAKAGSFILENKEMFKGDEFIYTIPTSKITFSYQNNPRRAEYKNLYRSFAQRPGSIDFQGNYFLIIKTSNTDFSSCQIFTKDVFNFKLTPFWAQKYSPNYAIIIPSKTQQ